MKSVLRYSSLFLLPLALFVACSPDGPVAADSPEESLQVQGQPLSHWVAQATAEGGPENLDATVAALAEAVSGDDPDGKRIAADALAVLGPKAIDALPALLEQFHHDFTWVRVSCQAAVGAMGKPAVPALIKMFEENTGGPRIRAAFVLGGIGPDAKEAVPVILRVIEEESPVMAERISGVLGGIDPERFAKKGTAGKANFDITAAGAAKIEAGLTSDWPQFHGPLRDSICREEGLLQEWPEGGPELLWTLEGLGDAYSTVSIVGGRFYTMGDRADGKGEDAEKTQYVMAYDLKSRKELWATPVGPPHDDGGPRSTPTVDGDSVYTLGTAGNLVCVDAETGELRWQVNLAEQFEGKVMAVWKYSESVLIDGDNVICTRPADRKRPWWH